MSVPIVPPEGIALPSGAASGVIPGPPSPRAFPSDAVVFYAACPGCSMTALWAEKRVDTHVEIGIDCRICDRRDRIRLAASAMSAPSGTLRGRLHQPAKEVDRWTE